LGSAKVWTASADAVCPSFAWARQWTQPLGGVSVARFLPGRGSGQPLGGVSVARFLPGRGSGHQLGGVDMQTSVGMMTLKPV